MAHSYATVAGVITIIVLTEWSFVLMLQMGKEKSATSAYRSPMAEHHVDRSLIHRILPSTDPGIPAAGRSCHGCRAGDQWDVNSEGQLVVSLSRAGGRVPGLYLLGGQLRAAEQGESLLH